MRDQAAVDEWFRRSADAGCPQGALGYGLALLRTATDGGARAAAQIMWAANANLPLGIHLLGVMSDVGTGVERDQTKAVQLYKQAAEKGLRPAQARYGLALLEGRAIEGMPSPARHGCGGRRWPATRKRPRCWATSTLAAASCRRTSWRRRIGLYDRPRVGMP